MPSGRKKNAAVRIRILNWCLDNVTPYKEMARELKVTPTRVRQLVREMVLSAALVARNPTEPLRWSNFARGPGSEALLAAWRTDPESISFPVTGGGGVGGPSTPRPTPQPELPPGPAPTAVRVHGARYSAKPFALPSGHPLRDARPLTPHWRTYALRKEAPRVIVHQRDELQGVVQITVSERTWRATVSVDMREYNEDRLDGSEAREYETAWQLIFQAAREGDFVGYTQRPLKVTKEAQVGVPGRRRFIEAVGKHGIQAPVVMDAPPTAPGQPQGALIADKSPGPWEIEGALQYASDIARVATVPLQRRLNTLAAEVERATRAVEERNAAAVEAQMAPLAERVRELERALDEVMKHSIELAQAVQAAARPTSATQPAPAAESPYAPPPPDPADPSYR